MLELDYTDEAVSCYEELGFNNRAEYLESLADEYGCTTTEVWALASVLGASEDFDGLVSSLEDAYCY